MSGYRDSSSFDPNASPHYGRPLRPYNWVQWLGVGCIVVGLLIDALYFAGRLGWLSRSNTPVLALPPILAGGVLINSRREGVTDPAPELAAERKRWLIIVSVGCAIILCIATLLDASGVVR